MGLLHFIDITKINVSRKVTIGNLHWDLLRFLMVPVAKPASSETTEFCQARRNSTSVPSGIDRCEGKLCIANTQSF